MIRRSMKTTFVRGANAALDGAVWLVGLAAMVGLIGAATIALVMAFMGVEVLVGRAQW